MSHCIIRVGDEYMTHRRPTERQYESRATFSENLDDARVFNGTGAAKRAAKHTLGPKKKFEIVPVTLVLSF